MGDPEPSSDAAKFKFYFPDKSVHPDDRRLALKISYRDVYLQISWTEDIPDSVLLHLFENLPALLKSAGDERKITEEIRDMDREIADLLTKDCDEE